MVVYSLAARFGMPVGHLQSLGHDVFSFAGNVQDDRIFYKCLRGGTPTLIRWTSFRYFNFGMYGVAIFFLISGFLILQSMEGRSPGQFLVKRLFRLYSLYSIGLLFTCGVLYGSARSGGLAFPYGIEAYSKNLSLLRGWFWVPSIDGVNWTMEVDVFFYLVCAAAAWLTLDMGSEKVMTILAGTVSLLVYLLHGVLPMLLSSQVYLFQFFSALELLSSFFPIMFIGMALRQYMTGRWGKRRGLFCAAFFYLTFCVNCRYFFTGQARAYYVSYGCAILTLYGFYRMRNLIDAHPNRLISWFADISFPMYLIHGAAGYALLGWLYRLGFGAWSFLIVSAGMLGLAAALHIYVELPAERFAKRVLERMEADV